MSIRKESAENDTGFYSPPSTATRILEALKNDNLTYIQLAKIIASDPLLAAKTLQIANSPFYALPQKINRLDKALAVLGLSTLRGIALSIYYDYGERVVPSFRGGF